MNNITFNSGILPRNDEEKICKNITEKFGNACINHDVKALQELHDDLWMGIDSQFTEPHVRAALNQLSDILFEMECHLWDTKYIDNFIKGSMEGKTTLAAKYD